ncbi:MAG: LysR family transcriptional regulator [Marinobacter sp.]|uniref:LysR family transcriptional regulator n=1 Tax=Marinobacter sp. TaxID=50741 RepID=UPI0034A0111F
MDRFLEMKTFCTVVDAKSFVRAAEAMGVSKAAVSRYVNDLETRLGTRLLHRTTRRLSLTDEGEVFYFRCRELLAGVDEAESELDVRSGGVRGLVRLNVPVSFGIGHLAPLWGKFHERYPEVRLGINLADRIVDIVEEGFDLAIRIATLPSSTLISRRMGTTRVVLCASPVYLKTHGLPAHPAELADHKIIAYNNLATRHDWHFKSPEGEVSVRVKPWMDTNNGDTCRAAALSHQGIILQPDFLVGEDLAAGRLVEILPDHRSVELGIYAVYPTRKFVTPKVRALVDFLTEELDGEP